MALGLASALGNLVGFHRPMTFIDGLANLKMGGFYPLKMAIENGDFTPVICYIAIKNGHRNSGFTELTNCDFP